VALSAASLLLAACGGSSSSTSVATSRPGNPIPTRYPPPSTTTPGVTTPNGAPRITEFKAPNQYRCMAGYPNRAQVTIGWNVPSATTVSLALDGRALPIPPLTHIYAPAQPPFEVPAGPASGIGAAIVFPCVPGQRHTIALSWRAGSSPVTRRVVTLTKAAS
jgi:hypothetical protein